MEKHPALIVLKALLQGQQIQIGEYNYEIGDDLEGRQRVWLADTYTLSQGWLGNITLDRFIRHCNELTEPELFTLGANNAMNELRLEKPARDAT